MSDKRIRSVGGQTVMCQDNEPLASSGWFRRVAVIATGSLGNIENSLRHAAHLVPLAPMAFRRILPQAVDEDLFEALLEAGDCDTAARHLFGPHTALSVETLADDGAFRAIVGCAFLKQPVEGFGDTPATAMLDAWSKWLVTLRLEFGSDLEADPAAGFGTPSSVKSVCRVS